MASHTPRPPQRRAAFFARCGARRGRCSTRPPGGVSSPGFVLATRRLRYVAARLPSPWVWGACVGFALVMVVLRPDLVSRRAPRALSALDLSRCCTSDPKRLPGHTPELPFRRPPQRRVTRLQRTTSSGIPLKTVYTPEDLTDCGSADPRSAIPANFPFTRGIYPTMYRGKLWTMRQYAGFGGARAIQCALPLSAGAGPDRAFRGVRSAHADGLRFRSSARARRSGQGRRGHLFARRHGGAVRGHSARDRSPLR